jgi:hypothetical protein
MFLCWLRVRALYDPRFFEKALAKRNEEAADSATRFREDLTSGALDPKAPGFNQGAFDRAPKPPTSDGEWLLLWHCRFSLSLSFMAATMGFRAGVVGMLNEAVNDHAMHSFLSDY